MSALLRKSVTDLTRRKARALFSILTLALAVASVGIFALPPLTDQAMRDEIAAGRLADVTLWTRPLELDAAELSALRRLPNVQAVQPRSYFQTHIYIGARRAKAVVVGIPDFSNQSVDVVHLESGSSPRVGTLLTEQQNQRQGRYDSRAGDVVRVTAADGAVRRLRIVGEARNLDQGMEVIWESTVVLYATSKTVSALSGGRGFDSLLLRLQDNSDRAVQATIDRLRERLRATIHDEPFSNLPEVRAPGDWPGKSALEQFSKVFYIVTLLALLSALVLIANTMTTLISEQTGEIGTMKAIGGRRRQIARVYLTTALLLGGLGAGAGALLGLALANVLTRYFGSTFFAISPGVAVDVPVLLASVALGLLAPPLAALPAIRRATRLSVRETLESTTSTVGAEAAVGRALRRVPFLPCTAQIGLRNVGRRRRRSLATALVVALAVGNLLAVLAVATAVTDTTRTEWRNHREDIRLWTSGRSGFNLDAQHLISTFPGVARAQPALVNDVEIERNAAFVWAVPNATLFTYRIADGRWFTAKEEGARARVVVLEHSIAQQAGKSVGDRVAIETAAGRAVFRVVGISSNQQENGFVAFTPLTTFRAVLQSPSRVDTYWIKTTSADHSFIDRTATRLEDTLAARGYEPGSEITYVATADNIAKNRTLTTTITVLGFVIVAISLVGLVNAITMSVLERTREIGILRCIGARARDVRRIFTAEGLVLALFGWLLGIPLGYALDWGVVWLLQQTLSVDVGVVFPAWNIVLVLAGTLVLTLLVLLLPIRRAVRLRPGDALRYA